MQENRRKSGGGWIGWVIFFVLIFGARFLPPLANWLSQVTGVAISPQIMLAVIIGGGVLISVVSSLIQTINQGRQANETHLPTSMSSPSSPPYSSPTPTRAPSSPPTSMRIPPPMSTDQALKQLGMGNPKLPAPPRFEPIINPIILTFGVIGMIVLGIFFFLALVATGSI
jgi:type IV secretory pathway VirB6-like protein